jgi:hypothetical protein
MRQHRARGGAGAASQRLRRPRRSGIAATALAAEGLELDVQVAQGGAEIIPQVVGGSAQVGFSNTPSLFSAAAEGLPVEIVAPAGGSPRAREPQVHNVDVRPDLVFAGYFVSSEWADDNEEVLDRFLAALHRSTTSSEVLGELMVDYGALEREPDLSELIRPGFCDPQTPPVTPCRLACR